MILVFPQATQKFNLFYRDIRLSLNGLDDYISKISRTYKKGQIDGVMFIVLDTFVFKDELERCFKNFFGNIPISFLTLRKETQGSMCTLLMAINALKDLQVTISSLDQMILDEPLELNFSSQDNVDVEVPIFNSNNDMFSYVLRDDDMQPIQVFEKRVVSREAIMGIYKVKDFSEFFNQSIELLEKYKGFRERIFFISDVLNSYLRASKSVKFLETNAIHYHKFKSLYEFEDILKNEKN